MSEPQPHRHVLIVDDDAIMGELLDALLTIEGYRVTRAVSGEEALQVIHQALDKPGVVLCDIQMPGLHGIELARAFASARSQGIVPESTVFLAMSGSSPRAEDSQAFDAFLRKPFSVDDFSQAVQRAREGGQTRSVATPVSQTVDARGRRPPLDEAIFEKLRTKIGSDSLRQLYDMTLDDVHTRIERIADAAERGDGSTVRHEAHTIKGSCGMVGALELQELAAATEGGSPVDTSALADFDSACKRLERMLNEKL